MKISNVAGNNVLIESESGGSLTLNEPEFVSLCQQALLLKNPRQPKEGGIQPILMTPMANVIVNLDAHHTEVVLRFVASNGFENAYSIGSDVAEFMRDQLTEKLAKIAAAKKGRTTN